MLTVAGGIILAVLFFVLFLPLVIRALRWAVSAAAVLVMFGLLAFGVTAFVHSGKTSTEWASGPNNGREPIIGEEEKPAPRQSRRR
jgi:hypothetical protein